MPQMKVQNVRFGPGQWRSISEAAAAEGVSVSQFVRDAAFARAVAYHAVVHDDRLEFACALSHALDDHPDLMARLEAVLDAARADENLLVGDQNGSPGVD